jgi:hypothetical protein
MSNPSTAATSVARDHLFQRSFQLKRIDGDHFAHTPVRVARQVEQGCDAPTVVQTSKPPTLRLVGSKVNQPAPGT